MKKTMSEMRKDGTFSDYYKKRGIRTFIIVSGILSRKETIETSGSLEKNKGLCPPNLLLIREKSVFNRSTVEMTIDFIFVFC